MIGMKMTHKAGAYKSARRAGAGKKVAVVMGEFKRGLLRSSAGGKVRKRRQAVAIAMSEAGLARKRKAYRPSAGKPWQRT